MSERIEQDRQHLLPLETSDPPESHAEGAKGNPLLRLLRSACRHWLLVLAVWMLVGGPAALAIWYAVKPTYTASAHVEVTPIQAAILYPDDLSPIGGFDSYLNTQGEVISTNSVLQAALADPILKGLPLLASEEPLASLRGAITVKAIPKTNLLRVSIKRSTADEASKLTRAVMKAYEAYAGGNDARSREDNKRILREERERIAAKLKQQTDSIAKLAERYHATSQEMFTALRDGVVQTSVQTAGELERARIEKLRLQSQFDQLQKDLVPTTMPAEDFVWKEQWIANDAVVKRLGEEIAQEAWQLLRYGDSAVHQKRKATLEAQLEGQKKRAEADADSRLQERRKAVLDDAKRKVMEQLAGVDRLVASLEASYDAQKNEGQEMGRLALEIQQIQNTADSQEEELKRVEERIRQLEIEGRRPARISVSVEPEFLPDGVEDKRYKLIPVAVAGALFLGVFLAFLKDLISGRLYATEDVEGNVGLRLLGALPALEDLRRGRITEQDFRESYRAIQATLAGTNPDGQIPRTLLVTSAQAAEGKTSLAISLAVSLAESGLRVLVIDGDVQAPRIDQTLKLNLPFGLRQVLLGERPLAEAVGPTPVPSLDALLSGRNGQSAGGLLTSRLAAGVLKAAADRYDHVIIDSPPVLGAADALIWAQVVDGVIFSSQAGYSNMRVMRQACTRIASAGGRICGAVICNVPVRESYYSYSAGYSQSGQGRAGGGSPRSSGRALPLVHLPADRGDADRPVADG